MAQPLVARHSKVKIHFACSAPLQEDAVGDDGREGGLGGIGQRQGVRDDGLGGGRRAGGGGSAHHGCRRRQRTTLQG